MNPRTRGQDEVHDLITANTPIFDQDLGDMFAPALSSEEDAVPLLGLPGSVDLCAMDVLRVVPLGELAPYVKAFDEKAVGGLACLEIWRSWVWKNAGQMLLVGHDVSRASSPIAILQFAGDDEAATWCERAHQSLR